MTEAAQAQKKIQNAQSSYGIRPTTQLVSELLSLTFPSDVLISTLFHPPMKLLTSSPQSPVFIPERSSQQVSLLSSKPSLSPLSFFTHLHPLPLPYSPLMHFYAKYFTSHIIKIYFNYLKWKYSLHRMALFRIIHIILVDHCSWGLFYILLHCL